MEMLEALSRTFEHTGQVVAGVTPSQLDSPTPCTDWKVRNVLAHMTGVVMNMGLGASGQPLLADVNDTPLAADLGAQFRAEADRTLAAWKAHGLDGMVDIGAGPMPAAAGIGINLLDTATHSWDIARATGGSAELPDDLATFVLEIARGIVSDDIRSFAGIYPAVAIADGASPTDQLVAFLGRRP